MIRTLTTVTTTSLCATTIALALVLLGGCSGGAHTVATPTAMPAEAVPTADALAVIDPGSSGLFGVGQVTIQTRSSGVRLAVSYPAASTSTGSSAPAPAPLADGARFPVVWTQPDGASSGDHFSYLSDHLASWGYVVVSSLHADGIAATNDAGLGNMFDELLASRDPTVVAIATHLDTTRVAVVAASSAAGSAFGQDLLPAVRAVVVFDAVPQAITGAARIRTPAMIMFAGAGEHRADPLAMRRVFDDAAPDVRPYLVYFPDAVSASFVDECTMKCPPIFTQQRAHELITRYVTSFLQTFVLDDARYAIALASPSQDEGEEVDDAPDAIITRIGS